MYKTPVLNEIGDVKSLTQTGNKVPGFSDQFIIVKTGDPGPGPGPGSGS
jgi:hypothetical protein